MITAPKPTKLSRKLLVVFVVFSSFTMLIALVGLWGTQKIIDSHHHVIEHSLPLVMSARSLSDETAALATITPNLRAINDFYALSDMRDSIEQDMAQIQQRIERLRHQDPDFKVDLMSAIIQNVSTNTLHQLDAVEQRVFLRDELFDLQDMCLQILERIGLILKAQINELPLDENQNNDRRKGRKHVFENVTKLKNEVLILENIVQSLTKLHSEQEILKLEEKYMARARSIVLDIMHLDQGVKKVALLVDNLMAAADSPLGLFGLSLQLSKIDIALRERGKRNRELSNDLKIEVDRFLSMAVQRAKRQGQEAEEVSQTLGRVSLVFVLISFILPVVVILKFVRPRIVNRLNRISEHTRDLMAGKLDITINTSGQDELSEMARALDSFRSNLVLRRKAEFDLRRKNEELEKFAYISSHDLKAPLKAIENLAEWIEEDSGDVLPQTSREHLTKLKGRVQRMLTLIEDLLAYARVDSREAIESLDMNQLIDEVIELTHIPEGFSVRRSEDLPPFEGPKGPWRQVAMNLIANAIKHHHQPDQGRVEISYHDQGHFHEILFQDNGPGIDEIFHSKVFHMFETLQSRDHVEGSGMGLAFVDKIVTTYGGSVVLESQKDRGALFKVRWPKQPMTQS